MCDITSTQFLNYQCLLSVWDSLSILKGTATLMISMSYQKELYEPCLFIQVSSKSVEKWGSYGHLMNSIWPTFSRHFEYLISFQIFFNCLILAINTIKASVFQQICSFVHMENVLLKIVASNPLVCLYLITHIFFY